MNYEEYYGRTKTPEQIKALQEARKRRTRFITGAVVGAVIVVGAGIYVLGGLTHVGPGRVGIVKHMDGQITTIEQGTHWTGWSVSVTEYPTYIQRSSMSMDVGTSDSQKMPVTVALQWEINPKDAASVYQSVGAQNIGYVSSAIVDQDVQIVTNQITHQYGWNDLLGSQMPQATDQIKAQLASDLASAGIILKSFGFTTVSQPAGMASAQQALATAELEKEKAQAAQNAAKISNETLIMNAEAQAKANELEAAGIKAKAQAMNQYTVQEDAINKWNGVLPGTYAGSSSLPFLNLK